jgi:hypothetical protein
MDNTVGQGNPFLFPFAQMVSRSSFEPLQPHHLKRFFYPSPNTFLIQSHIERTESHIIKDDRAEELTLRLPGINAGACSGLTLSGALLTALKGGA